MYAFMRTLGMTIGVAIGGTIFQNLMKKKLNELGLPEDIAKDAEGYVYAVLKSGQVDEAMRSKVLEAYVKGFQGVFIFMTAANGFALMGSVAIKRFSLDRILVSRYRLKE